MTGLIWDHICYFLSNDLSNKSSILSILWSLSLCCVSIWSISFEFCASNFSIRSDFKLGLIFFFGNSAFVSNVSSLSPFSNFLFKHSLVFGYSFSRPVSKDTLSFVDALFPYAPSNTSLCFQSIRSAPVFELWSFYFFILFLQTFPLVNYLLLCQFQPLTIQFLCNSLPQGVMRLVTTEIFLFGLSTVYKAFFFCDRPNMNRLKYIYINLNVACQVFQRGDCEIPPKTYTYHLTLEYSLLTLFFLLSPKENKVQKNFCALRWRVKKNISKFFSG